MKYKNLSVHKLRLAGYKVKVRHARLRKKITKLDGTKKEISPKGGYTTVVLTLPNSLLSFEETAICSLDKSFNKKIQIHTCLGRIFKKHNLELPTKIVTNPQRLLTSWEICV